jgi:hypothetical protein
MELDLAGQLDSVVEDGWFIESPVFLLLVEGIITISLGLMDNFVLSHHCWTMPRAVCKTLYTV